MSKKKIWEDGTHYLHHKNGVIKEVFTTVNNRKHGLCRKYDQRHILMEEVEYKYGHVVRRRKDDWRECPVNRNHLGMAQWLEDREGNVWHVENYQFDYQTRVDMTNKRYTGCGGAGCPTLQELIEKGDLQECHPYRTVNMMYDRQGGFPEDVDVRYVQEYFRKEGYEVSEEAIMFCFRNWQAMMKSGYRDEKNNYHLFTPCGENPLQFCLTTLCEQCEDWQKTYIA